MNTYYVIITDTFGGKANFSWVISQRIVAKSVRGVLQKLAKLSGLHWHHVGLDRWDSESGATCWFVEDWDDEIHGYVNLDTDDLS